MIKTSTKDCWRNGNGSSTVLILVDGLGGALTVISGDTSVVYDESSGVVYLSVGTVKNLFYKKLEL